MRNEQQEECFLKLKWMKLGPGSANYRSAFVLQDLSLTSLFRRSIISARNFMEIAVSTR